MNLLTFVYNQELKLFCESVCSINLFDGGRTAAFDCCPLHYDF